MWQIAGELEEARNKRDAEEKKKASTPVAVLNIRLEGEHHLCELMLFIPSKTASGGFKEVKIRGPRRRLRAEAMKDGFELRKGFHAAGEVEVRKRLQELRKTTWEQQVLPPENAKLEEPADLEQRLRLAQRPAGTGWSRKKDAEFFLHTLAPMAYDPKKRQYFEIDATTQRYNPCAPPHDPTEYPIAVSAGSSMVGRDDGDLGAPERPRTLLLKELVKTGAAMKKPLFFLDQPASCFALFEGVRGTAAVDWVCKNFHTKLLSRLSSCLQYWSNSMIESLLTSIFEELDAELLQQAATCYDGVSLAIALFLGDRLTVATLGAVRGLWLSSSAEPLILGDQHWVCEEGSERQRIDAACGEVKACGEAEAAANRGLLLQRPLQPRQTATEEQGQRAEIQRVLAASPDSFTTLGFGADDSVDGRTARSLYKKLALRVHPDKAPEDFKAQAKEAFAKVEAAAEAVEALCDANAEATEKLHRILRAAGDISSPVMPQSWARSLLGIEEGAEPEEAEKKGEKMKKDLGKLGLYADGRLGHPDAARAGRLLDDALEVLAAPKPAKEGEKLAPVGVTRALGLRDLKKPRPIVLAKPHIDTIQLESGGSHHLVLLSKSTTALDDKEIIERVRCFARQPKAATLTIAQEAAAHHLKNERPRSQCLAGVVVGLFEVQADLVEEPPAKKSRTDPKGKVADQGDKIRACHILLKHKDLKMAKDPESLLRLKGKTVTRSVAQAERELLEMQRVLAKDPHQFPVLARKHSECDSATQPGQSAGDLGWVARGCGGQLEQAMFNLRIYEVSDIVSTPRGLHIIQRIA